ncbi:pseudouridine synthase [Devriesea agamarum]|uniref:pseudouridine synthase n=1 Tax=Devriesea agamarum TaxID=472569 RepID=UPI00071DD338|nr:pseudouridine synthase [Devriesea agamarum]
MVKQRRRSAFTPPRTVRLRDGEGSVRSTPELETIHVDGGERLQKILAQAGLGSRRACEVLIGQGRVCVDGVTVTEQGIRVDPRTQAIHVDGRRIRVGEDKLTLVLNKPRHVVTSLSDPEGRRDLTEFIAQAGRRLVHVGRLDYETEGLLLLTDDGDLAHRLTHPSFEVTKTYVCAFPCRGTFPRGLLKALRDGVDLEDGPAKADRARMLAHDGREAVVELSLHEGRNRIVRRMFESQGFTLTRLVRTRIGPVLLGDLRSGQTRKLTDQELGTLYAEVGL